MAHRAFGLYVHITWHTRLRQRVLKLADADIVRAAIREAAARC
jgi:REP element-mobilizing transposase RayT